MEDNMNINLDDIKPGLEEQYNLLCRKEYENFETYSKKSKKMHRFLIILGFVLAFLWAFALAKFDLTYDMPESVVGGVFLLLIFAPIFIVLLKKDTRREKSHKVQEQMYNFLKPIAYKYDNCYGTELQEQYNASVLIPESYDNYSPRNYKKYFLKDGRVAQEVECVVSKKHRSEELIMFAGKLIVIENENLIEHRIDILSEAEEAETELKLDETRFEQKFKVFCKDENYAYQIITSDIIHLIMNFYNETKIMCNVILDNNNIYIKLNTYTQRFYSNQLNNPFNKKTIAYCCKHYMDVMNFIEDLSDKIINRI